MEKLHEGYPVSHFSGATKRFCQTLDLRDDPELIATYKYLHSEKGIWQETLGAIHAVGILEMDIYILGTRLFMIVELPANLNWDEVMKKMGAEPKQKEWEALTAIYQKVNPTAGSAEKWQLMERIFHLYK